MWSELNFGHKYYANENMAIDLCVLTTTSNLKNKQFNKSATTLIKTSVQ